MYQQVRLSDLSLVGTPGPVPANLVGLPDAVLADIPAHIDPPPAGFEGAGLWPVVVTTPVFDPGVQALAGTATLGTPDPATYTVLATADLRNLTAGELAILHPVPATISRRQFYQQLAIDNLITQDEALAALTGTIPAAMGSIVASLPAAQQFGVRMLLVGAQEFARDNAFVSVFQAAESMTGAEIDALWVAASAL